MENLTTTSELREAFSTDSRYKEIWAETKDGQLMCALANGDSGWLMYLREAGDAGFSSRNPSYAGAENAAQFYRLDNGQIDEYPLSWAISVDEILKAMVYFIEEGKPSPLIVWHDDSGDGEEIGL